MHLQLVSESEDEEQAEERIHYYTTSNAAAENEERAELTQNIDAMFPGAIVRG